MKTVRHVNLQIGWTDEADLLAFNVGAKDPRNVFHVGERRHRTIRVLVAEFDGKRDALLVTQVGAFDHFFGQARAADDGGVTAGMTERDGV